jgi:DNA-directed RNA polymerase specialized sigma24 family protein
MADDDNSGADEPYHPAFVARALDWAEGLDSHELLAAARIRDEDASGFLPPAALVRLIRRFRTEGDDDLSTRLSTLLIGRAYEYVREIYAKMGADKHDVVQETMQMFLTELAEQDGVDWWEVTFYRELRRRAADAYRSLFKRHRRSSFPLPDDYDRTDAGAEAATITRRAALKAFAEIHVASEEKRWLFVLLMEGELPIAAPEAPNDLVRLTGLKRSTLANLKTKYGRMLNAALSEKTS